MESKQSNNRKFSSVAEAFAYLENFANFEKRLMDSTEYRLDRMRALLALSGNPQRYCQAIHIAGSKGKGSTTTFCATILSRMGYRTGQYTSPHIRDYRERISLADGFFTDARYIDTIQEIADLVDSLEQNRDWDLGKPTTFELLTLAAYLIFRAEKVQWMVIETGLGGRLDATNLMEPIACLITALELEHTDILGDTLEKIAQEKAGIFKTGAYLFSQAQEETALRVLQAKATDLGLPLSLPNQVQKTSNGWQIALSTSRTKNPQPIVVRLGIEGDFQIYNAEIAVRTIVKLWENDAFPEIATLGQLEQAISDGLANAHIRGRLEHFQGIIAGNTREIIVDGAHTARSSSLISEYFNPQPSDILLFGSVEGKNHFEMAQFLAPGFGKIIITTPGHFKKSDPPAVFNSFKNLNSNTFLILDPKASLAAVFDWLAVNPDGRVLVTGSFYLAGAIIPELQAKGFSSRLES